MRRIYAICVNVFLLKSFACDRFSFPDIFPKYVQTIARDRPKEIKTNRGKKTLLPSINEFYSHLSGLYIYRDYYRRIIRSKMCVKRYTHNTCIRRFVSQSPCESSKPFGSPRYTIGHRQKKNRRISEHFFSDQ